MRRRKSGRLTVIADAALRVFTEKGYRAAQMADIAAAAGVSAGALYSYVDDKDALFELALGLALGLPADESHLPIRSRGLGPGTPAGKAIARLAAWPALAAAAARRERGREADIEPVLREIFDLVSDRRRLIWLLDRCAREMTDIAGMRAALMRRGKIIADFADFAGRFGRSQEEARAVFEMAIWMGLHRHLDPAASKIEDDEAFAAALAMATGALMSNAKKP